MAVLNNSTNAGVHGSNGIEFQKHCALYLLFEKYATIENRQYFICMEHYDDFLFCFLTHNNLITSIEAYQAKKSSSQWGMGVDLSDILKKMTQVGLDLIADPHPKDSGYSHDLRFVTNNSVKLYCGKRKNGQSVLINEGNTEVKYTNLHPDIQVNILKGLRAQSVVAANQISELDNLSLTYIDLPKRAQVQKDSLVGQFNRIFGAQVNDPVAAVDALLLLFRDVENVLNNGNIVRLMDTSKRIDSSAIRAAMNIITSKAKAYDFWRQRGDNLANRLSIVVFERDRFRLQFQNSFDFFKDLKQAEHQKLLKYVVENKARWRVHTNEVDCINDMYTSFVAENSTNLLPLDIKAAICAAYLELKG